MSFHSKTVGKTYTRLIIVLGLALFAQELREWQSTDALQYASYFTLSVLASVLQVSWRTQQGLVPINLFFVMISLRTLSAPETFMLGACSALAEHWQKGKTHSERLREGLFAVGVMSIALGMADMARAATWLPAMRKEISEAVNAILMGATFFAGVSIPWATRTALESGTRTTTAWWAGHFWMLPFYLAGSVLASLFDRARSEVGWQALVLAVPVIYLLYRSYRIYMARLEDGRMHAEEVATLHLRTIEALAMAIDAKDQNTHDHLCRVQVYAVELGRELGLGEEELQALRTASLLHDIGKLAVPEHIISKPGRLTPEEFEKMKIHPIVGAEILERVRFPYAVVPIVRSHHERWDGKGYPDGLIGEAIPIGARILSAVDCLDALSTDRQYRRAMPLAEAIRVIIRDAGTAFDPRIAELLARRYEDFERITQAQRSAPMKLSTDIRVAADTAPAAGYETTSAGPPTGTSPQEAPDFLLKIAAARQEAHALFELVQNLGNSLSLDETLSVLSVRLKKIVPFDAMAVYMRREDRLLPEFVSGDNSRLFASLEIPTGQGLSGWVAETGKPILNGNPSVEPGYTNDPTRFSTLRSALAVPLESLTGVVGVLTLYGSERDCFNKDHLRIVLAVSSKLGLTLENALRYRQAETSATTDFLTRLPNARSLFLHLDGEVARSRHAGHPLTVLVCDLDNFKQVNDQYGHLEGNKALRIVAKALRDNCREHDYVARMGGDEFVVVLPGMAQEAVIPRLEQLRRIAVDETKLQLGLEITISVGAAYLPDDGQDAEELLTAADRRMYKAKAESPSRLNAKRAYLDAWQGTTTIQ